MVTPARPFSGRLGAISRRPVLELGLLALASAGCSTHPMGGPEEPLTPVTVSPTAVWSGDLDVNGPAKEFSVHLDAGQDVILAADGHYASARYELVRPGDEVGAEFTVFSDDVSDGLEYRAQESGTHLVRVSPLPPEAGVTRPGRYVFWLRQGGRSGTDTRSAIQPGEALSGRIDIPGERDWFATTLEAGRRYVVTVTATDAGTDGLDLELLDPSGEEVLASAESGGRDVTTLSHRIARAGAYFIVTSPAGDQLVGYRLAMAEGGDVEGSVDELRSRNRRQPSRR